FELLTDLLDSSQVALETVRDRDGWEFNTCHCAGLEHSLQLTIETGNLVLDHLSDVLRDSETELAQRHDQLPPAINLCHQALSLKVVDNIGEEERIAFGATVKQAVQPLGKII